MRSSLSLLFEYVQRAFGASQRTFVSLYALEDNLMHVRALLHFDTKKNGNSPMHHFPLLYRTRNVVWRNVYPAFASGVVALQLYGALSWFKRVHSVQVALNPGALRVFACVHLSPKEKSVN